ncbi:type II toxin-antitoxin system Phd/YefM family antitoxin [Georgenia yuyongxinii]|uniref:type II toxin-antitoxin system Phd/YefM family antitoxin n=1 Tax=Georgenia yuyongxinii TaxID=2589797 RepID=UPI001CB74F09|nr:type II toxin-antitoxin system prevent-host-death family antitoxin [Georgenia yuyongxinii]
MNMHEAKTHLSRLVKEEFIIANNGKPVARVIPIVDAPAVPRVGFLPPSIAAETKIPDDFDEMMSDDVAELFGLGQ